MKFNVSKSGLQSVGLACVIAAAITTYVAMTDKSRQQKEWETYRDSVGCATTYEEQTHLGDGDMLKTKTYVCGDGNQYRVMDINGRFSGVRYDR